METEQKGLRAFLKRKGVEITVKRYLIDAMSSMAMGLFASLLIGTIFNTIADKLEVQWLSDTAAFATSAAGPAMAVAIGFAHDKNRNNGRFEFASEIGRTRRSRGHFA